MEDHSSQLLTASVESLTPRTTPAQDQVPGHRIICPLPRSADRIKLVDENLAA